MDQLNLGGVCGTNGGANEYHSIEMVAVRDHRPAGPRAHAHTHRVHTDHFAGLGREDGGARHQGLPQLVVVIGALERVPYRRPARSLRGDLER